jgi:hypothetical protein
MGPSVDDVKAGTSFAFAHRSHEMGWFLDQQWIDAWLREVFAELARPRLKKDAEDIRIETGELQHQAHICYHNKDNINQLLHIVRCLS